MEPEGFQEAIQSVQQGQRKKAYRLMRQILLEHPNYAPAWFWMSKLDDNADHQRDCLERALTLDPDYKPARDRLEYLRLREQIVAPSNDTPTTTPTPRQIGEYLVDHNFISQAQLGQALAEQRAQQRHGRRIPLGDILIRRGWISPKMLATALVLQGQEKLLTRQNGSPERLGEFLLFQGIITATQLENVLAEQASLNQGGRYMALGELMIRHGYVTPEALQQALEVRWNDYLDPLS